MKEHLNMGEENPNCFICKYNNIIKINGMRLYDCTKRVILDLEYCRFYHHNFNKDFLKKKARKRKGIRNNIRDVRNTK